ncbi:hypothetical protein [Granulicella sp. S156]|uniref:hypothetical protein n=1 Tax=Granulicella sp. S156 TaxID=1747224 RepID=UPI00131C072A|nr:hypothetical protein [Granulicella sp. S156]
MNFAPDIASLRSVFGVPDVPLRYRFCDSRKAAAITSSNVIQSGANGKDDEITIVADPEAAMQLTLKDAEVPLR